MDEKERQGNSFVWGVETGRGKNGNGQSQGGANSKTGTSSSDDTSFNFNDDLEEYEKIVAYVTFSLNGFFILFFVAWAIFKCICGNRRSSPTALLTID